MTTLQNTTVFKSAMRARMSYGTLPPESHFRQAFAEDLGADGIYEIRNCRELDAVYPNGNKDFTCDELWDFLCQLEWHGFGTNHELEDLCSSILYTLGFEWV